MNPVYEHAADWVQRLDDPQLQEQDLHAWLEWFAASDAHRRAFEEVQALRTRLRSVPEEYRRDIRAILNLQSPAHRSAFARSHRFTLAAVFSAIAIAALFWWTTHTSPPREIVYSAPFTHPRTVPLEDGSTLVLAADSIIAVTYSPERRDLDILRGEAYFEVHSSPGRPFTVQAGSVRVTALGTAFNVVRGPGNVTVTVTQGVVDVQGDDTRQRMAAGQRTKFAMPDAPPESVAASSVMPIAWQDDRADFVDAPLNQVLAALSPHLPNPVFAGDPRLAELTYSGTILHGHLDEWLDSLPRVYPIRAVSMDDGSIAWIMNPLRRP